MTSVLSTMNGKVEVMIIFVTDDSIIIPPQKAWKVVAVLFVVVYITHNMM